MISNFYIDCDIDGRRTKLKGGPRRKDGGFNMTIKQRDEGGILEVFQIDGYCDKDGKLSIEAFPVSDKAEVIVEGKKMGFIVNTKR